MDQFHCNEHTSNVILSFLSATPQRVERKHADEDRTNQQNLNTDPDGTPSTSERRPVPSAVPCMITKKGLLMMQEWRPTSTHCLLSPWRSIEACSVVDHAFGKSFLGDIRKEINDTNLLKRLRPSRTAMDNKFDIGLFESFTKTKPLGENIMNSNLRGDSSVIIPRSFRSTDKFVSQYPLLHHLVTSIETTARNCLEDESYTQIGSKNKSDQQSRCRIEFDTSMTSVQLATYPGDGTSGYVRHCDTGAKCKSPHDHDHGGHDRDQVEETAPRRIVTAVYYLTEDDWGVEDGGCLRIFDTIEESDSEEEFHDIIPYADRLILFRSDLVEHQVLPSKKRTRMAITVWLYGRAIQTEASGVSRGISSKKAEIQTLQDLKAKLSKGTEDSHRATTRPLPIDSASEGVGVSRDEERIFVSIPAYRDSETLPTIKSLIENASMPNRIYIGVVYQYDTSSEEEHAMYQQNGSLPLPWATSNLRSMILDYRNATGPCYARYLTQSLHRGEEYILQIDSHMRFRSGWDEYLIQQLNKCEDPAKSVLTTYPQGYFLPNDIPDDTRATILVPWKFDGDGMLRQKGRLLREDDMSISLSSPNPNSLKLATSNNNIPCMLYAAGFNFSSCKILMDCPYEMLHHLFFGEELSMAVRLYTNGYNLYAPPMAVCYHLWSRGHRTTFQADVGISSLDKEEGSQLFHGVKGQKLESIQQVRNQLLGKGHGLGTIRKVEGFWNSLGVDFKNEEISEGSQNAGLDPKCFVSTAVPMNDSHKVKLIENVLGVLSLHSN